MENPPGLWTVFSLAEKLHYLRRGHNVSTCGMWRHPVCCIICSINCQRGCWLNRILRFSKDVGGTSTEGRLIVCWQASSVRASPVCLVSMSSVPAGFRREDPCTWWPRGHRWLQTASAVWGHLWSRDEFSAARLHGVRGGRMVWTCAAAAVTPGWVKKKKKKEGLMKLSKAYKERLGQQTFLCPAVEAFLTLMRCGIHCE